MRVLFFAEKIRKNLILLIIGFSIYNFFLLLCLSLLVLMFFLQNIPCLQVELSPVSHRVEFVLVVQMVGGLGPAVAVGVVLLAFGVTSTCPSQRAATTLLLK